MTSRSNDEIIDLILGGKSAQLEFSDENLGDPAIAKHLVAFSNSKGGTLLFGIDDDNQVAGIQLPDLGYRVMDIAANLIHPAIFPRYYEVNITGKKVGVVDVDEGDLKPYHSYWKGKQHFYIRANRASTTATANQIATLMKKSGNLRYELMPVIQASSDDLDRQRLHHFCLTRRRINLNGLSEKERIDVLKKLDILTTHKNKNVPTNSGLLLFGKEPTSLLSHVGISIYIYSGTETDADSLTMACTAALMGVHDDQTGKIITKGAIDEVMDVIEENIPKIKNKNETRLAYPVDSVREAIVNAVLHRDYCITDSDIRVNLFEDRIEVISPGALYERMTLEKIKLGARYPRNLLLYHYLGDGGYFDRNKLGLFDTIMQTSEQYTGKAPLFEELNNKVKVTIYAKLP